MLKPKMRSLNDPEGAIVPLGLPPVIDCHVHVFPPFLFQSVWKWFDEHGWRIRYQLTTEEIFAFLLDRGIQHIVALQYAHKAGIARELNRYMVERCARMPGRITGLATVYPGEDDGVDILEEAFRAGLGGLKLHAHVQCFDVNSASMEPLYDCCRRHDKPILMHVGREPKSSAYKCDPHKICKADKLERVLRDFPGLRICVPHLGFDELEAYRRLLERYDTLWLDTTMVITDYFPLQEAVDLSAYRIERILYGSDFPNIPYAWDRELKVLQATGMTEDALAKITWKNAADLFAIDLPDPDDHQESATACPWPLGTGEEPFNKA